MADNTRQIMKALFTAAYSPAQNFEQVKDDEHFQKLARSVDMADEKFNEKFMELFDYTVKKIAYGNVEASEEKALTFAKVIYVFSNYLNENQNVEVVKVKHGFAALLWDPKIQEYIITEGFQTPDELAVFLADSYYCYHELQVNGNGKRDLTPEEADEINKASEALLNKCFED